MAPMLAPEGLRAALAEGAPAAIPSPCGWLALARPSAREALARLVDPASIALTAADRSLLSEYLPPHGLRAERMIARLLPGPVAIRLGEDGPLLRLPDDPLWRQAIDREGGPLLAAPLQQGGERLWPAAEIEARWPGLAMVEAAPDRPRTAETIVQVKRGAMTVVEAGDVDGERLRAAARLLLLCVCSGNTCRSPMLASLLRAGIERRGLADITVESAGAAATLGASSSPEAVTVMHARGIDLTTHRSRPVAKLDLSAYDRIWCMTPGHAVALRQLRIDQARIRVVASEKGGIPDPFGGPEAVYEECAQALERAVTTIMDDL